MAIEAPRQLEPEQAAAAYTIDRHVSVTAGPGSGKTTVLVERYLHILRQQNLSIDQIVAITFTNRAANEMRERLRERLNHILQTTEGDERKRWLHYKRTLDGAVITTIHGFCARLLREFPVEARVDPQFLLLDEHRAAMLLESVVEESLTEFISSGHVEISRLTLGVGRGRLAAALAQIYREMRGQGLSPAELALKTAASHATEDDHAQALGDLSRAMREFLACRRTTALARSNQAEVSSTWAVLWPFLQTIPEIEELADYCRAIETFRELRPQARGELKPFVQTLDELIWAKDLLGRLPQTTLDLFARHYALELVNVLSRVDERLNEEKQKLSALDFDDLELRALSLLENPAVLTRAAERYKFYLVDEFQDTNGLQRQLLERLALQTGTKDSANLFIVGDRKQSIYGFRGADVDVFREMTRTLTTRQGHEQPLLLNFRSQPPLINFFNYLFARLFLPAEQTSAAELPEEMLNELGYVSHEASEAKRELRDEGPLVEFLITSEAVTDAADPKFERDSRELDAEQLAQRIRQLVSPGWVSTATTDKRTVDTGTAGVPPDSSSENTQVKGDPVNWGSLLSKECGPTRGPGDQGPDQGGPAISVTRYSDVALLFRAMTRVHFYEAAFRRANIPYQTVLGRGFYEREEITDLIQLLRFLDNKTDELALAAVLRSPLCGISDNALLALRCAPSLEGSSDPLRHFNQTRRLFSALRDHREIALVSDEEHELLDRAAWLIRDLITRRHHYALSDLLRFAVERSEYQAVIAATFDGAQRLANVERLFTLAERFEGAGTHLIRDFVRYVEEFEAIGSRESEGQIDEAANAVRLMTIHQAKGLEFPVVIMPELQRYSKMMENWFLLDRHRGLTLKVPDGRGKQVAGCTFTRFEQRQAQREQFESMRLLYVAATRAQDRLIFSGTARDFDSLGATGGTWLNWIWQSLELTPQTESRILEPAAGVEIQLSLNSSNLNSDKKPQSASSEVLPDPTDEPAGSLPETFPLLRTIAPAETAAWHRFSVTQLINYRRCPRQYYFDRVLRVPSAEELAVWNNAEAPEPPANLTATLKGAVIHRFCENFLPGDDATRCLQESFLELLRLRQAQFADRVFDIDTEKAVAELLPLANNYLASDVFKRINKARAAKNDEANGWPEKENGLWSELAFRLRRPQGVLSGAIDKLLITTAGDGHEIEIIDFKTNRFQIRANAGAKPLSSETKSSSLGPRASQTQSRAAKLLANNQIAFDFAREKPPFARGTTPDNQSDSLRDEVARTAADYQLQMQAYALAAYELLPALATERDRLKVTLHFLDPNVEYALPAHLLSPAECSSAIDAAMNEIVSAREPENFPVHPARHCRMCNFLELCPAGRDWLDQ